MEINCSTSDVFHTFDEIYHRTLLFAAICNMLHDCSWKSRKHADGTMYDGYFIAGLVTDKGDATYYCELKYWDRFEVIERVTAPQFDGHTPEQAVQRIFDHASKEVPF